MIKALNTAATGLEAQQENMEVISNNLANVGTNGFKKSRAEFEDLMYQTVKEPGQASKRYEFSFSNRSSNWSWCENRSYSKRFFLRKCDSDKTAF